MRRRVQWACLKKKKVLLSPSQITVSSGGMLTQKLDTDDIQLEKGAFDGTMAYAQNKAKGPDSERRRRNSCHVMPCCAEVLFFLCSVQRQQVILTEQWASRHKEIHFSSMHPGWADTPGELQTRAKRQGSFGTLRSFWGCGNCRVISPKSVMKSLHHGLHAHLDGYVCLTE